MPENYADIVELFSSIQGEGPYIGYRQIFVRFGGCNLTCDYCDTNFSIPEFIKIEKTPGKNDFEEIKNPIDTDLLFFYINKLNEPHKSHHSISLTGGEPLLQVDFLKLMLAENFAKHKHKIYLETNGTLFEELSRIVKLVDIVSMDIKIPSATKNQVENWHLHKQFLEVLEENKKSKIEYFVKIVINNDFSDYELRNVIWCISSSESGAPLYIQPDFNNPPDNQKLLDWQMRLSNQLGEVRIIPQVHKYLNVK